MALPELDVVDGKAIVSIAAVASHPQLKLPRSKTQDVYDRPPALPATASSNVLMAKRPQSLLLHKMTRPPPLVSPSHLNVSCLADATAADGPLSPFRALKQRGLQHEEARAPQDEASELGPSSEIFSRPAPSEKVISQAELFNFWASVQEYARSALRLDEVDGEDKDVEMRGITLRAMKIAKHGFYVNCRKGSKGKSEKVNQDAFSSCILSTGLKIYVVCDGHGHEGDKIAQRISRTIPYFLNLFAAPTSTLCRQRIEWAFDSAHSELIAYARCNSIDMFQAGSVVNVVVIDEDKVKHETRIWSAHTGDSRTLAMVFKKSLDLVEMWTSEDHTPTKDKERILKNGGEIIVEKVKDQPAGSNCIERVYVQGKNYPGLRLGRAFGDLCCHSQNITTHEPDIHLITKKSDQVGLIFVASDGVWEFLKTEEVAKRVTGILKTRNKLNLPLQEGLVKIINLVTSDATEKWRALGEYCDDITCMVALV
eukprot:GEMP01016575.1.p1 GENE.GEMP01016575.1~~GEMP01016575.1.p1  ORF type:complete len:482 (+),score=84.04 GEMP01016575.1:100-1545(+)